MKALLLMLALCTSLAQAAPAALAIRSFEADSMAAIEAAHRGKPFVVMVWSLDCAYCPAALAALGKQRELPVVTIATDAVEAHRKQIAAKLGPKLMKTEAWAFGDAPPEQLRYALDPKWRGETPRSYWYDAKGVRTARSGPVTLERIAEFVRQQPLSP